MKLFRRKSVTVNWKLQGGLCLRICFYWLTCLFLACLLFAARPLLEGTISPGELMGTFWSDYFRPVSASLLLLPVLLVDSLIFSNRVAGPLYRFELELAKLTNGKQARQINLRPKDFGHKAAAHLNQLIEKHNEALACEEGSEGKGAKTEEAAELVSC